MDRSLRSTRLPWLGSLVMPTRAPLRFGFYRNLSSRRSGLLDGRRATTHWQHAEQLAALFPQVTVDPDPIFVKDGKFYTSAGVTAGLDLALALVEEDAGRDLALDVTRRLVMFLKRPGAQSQLSIHLAVQLSSLRDAASPAMGPGTFDR